jgi:hypothetical protein
MAVNPSTAIPAGRFPYAGYKSGSETGVISMNYLIHTADGKHFVMSAIWNNKAKAVSRSELGNLMSAAGDFLERSHKEVAASVGI